jgi:release factor glutamine methyltransferase
VTDEFGIPEGEYDLIVANLPYVPDADWDQMQPEIRGYEPREAFVSGQDGLDAIRELIAAAPSGTHVVLEHGNEQGATVRDLLDDARSFPDLANWERITVGRVP